VGTQVQLLRANVTILRNRQQAALDALKYLSATRHDLMGGWRTNDQGERTPHWSFTDGDVGAAETLVDALDVLRFAAMVAPDGDIIGVELIGGTRSQGDERHHWTVLAPFVEAGGVMDWYNENQEVWSWRFDGSAMRVIRGSLLFDE
jgi:hypothetical protein